MQKHGMVEDLFIYYHPVTNKHLGIGRVIFETVQGAKGCVEKLNNTSVMGKILQVFLDPFGDKCKVKFEEYTVEKKPPMPVVEEKPKKLESEMARKSEDEKRTDSKDGVRDRDRERDAETKKNVKERDNKYMKDRDRDRYARNYVRNEYATPSSSDMGYGTSEYSYGSSNTTPIR